MSSFMCINNLKLNEFIRHEKAKKKRLNIGGD